MFPDYKTKKFLFLKIGKIEDGWEDLGFVKKISSDDGIFIDTVVCFFCHERTRVGRENNKTFKFCPRCLVKY